MKQAPLVVTLLIVSLALPAIAAAPMVAINSPQPDASINTDTHPVAVLFDAGDRTIDQVQLYVDGKLHATVPVNPAMAAGSVTLAWEVAKFTNGPHRLSVQVRDSKGEQAEAAANIFVDRGNKATGAPVVRVEYPQQGGVVTGTANVQMRAFDPDGIKYVMLLVDDMFACLTNMPPYTYAWNTTRLPNGAHTLQAKAFDSAENEGISPKVEVVVDNPGGRTEMQEPETAVPSPAPADPVLGLPEPATLAPTSPIPPAAEPAKAAVEPAPAPPAAAQPEVTAPAAPAPAQPALAPSVGVGRWTAPGPKPNELALAPTARPEIFGETVFATPAAPLTRAVSSAATPPAAPAALAPSQGAPAAPVAARQTAPAPSRPASAVAKPPSPAKPAPAPAKVAMLAPAAMPKPALTPVAVTPAPATPTAAASAASVATSPAISQGQPRAKAAMPSRPAVAVTAPKPAAASTSAAKVAKTPAPVQVALAVSAEPRPAAFQPAASKPATPVQRTVAASAPVTAATGPTVAAMTMVAMAPSQLAVQARPVVTTVRPGATLFLNDQALPSDVQPILTGDGLALAPFRHIIEGAGGTVSWLPAAQVIKAEASGSDITLTIGSYNALVNDRTILLDVATFLSHGRAIVPVRFFRDALGYEVRYDAATGGVYIAVK